MTVVTTMTTTIPDYTCEGSRTFDGFTDPSEGDCRWGGGGVGDSSSLRRVNRRGTPVREGWVVVSNRVVSDVSTYGSLPIPVLVDRTVLVGTELTDSCSGSPDA